MKNLLYFSLLILITSNATAQLTGINPSVVPVNIGHLQTTISSAGLFQVVSSGGQTNIDHFYLKRGNDHIYCNFPSFSMISSNQVSANFDIPLQSDTGLYDLVMVEYQTLNLHVLNNAFTILPLNGAAEGNVYKDLNKNGARDTGEPGIPNMYLYGAISGGVPADSNGFFSFPLLNGTHSISCFPSPQRYYVATTPNSYTISINNDTVSNLDFGFTDGIFGMTPSSGFYHQLINAYVYSDSLFVPGPDPWGNVTSGKLSKNGFTLQIPSSAITVISPNEVHIAFSFTQSATGLYDLSLVVNGYTYYQDAAFTLVPPPSLITGKIYYDANQDGSFTPGEPPIGGERVFISPDSMYAFSGVNGQYALAAYLGSHTVSVQPSPVYTVTSAPSQSFTNTGNVSNVDFGMIYNSPTPAAELNFIPGFMRCNNNVTSTLSLKNISNYLSDGVVWLLPGSNMTFVSANSPVSYQNGDTLFWTFNNLQPAETRTISVTMHLPGFGSTVQFQAMIQLTDAQGNVIFSSPADGLYPVACSYDPNDKTCNPPGVDDLMHYTLLSDTLEYLIRFQNSGNDTAFNIIIRDTIDSSLDLNTFQLLEVSHPVQLQIDSTRQAVFRFNNIQLPDSNVDEPNSHGYILYRILPKAQLPDPTRVENTAYIYFDFNPPVRTNTTWNTLVSVLPISVDEITSNESGAFLYPNPVSEISAIYFENDASEVCTMEIFDVTGKLVYLDKTSSQRFTITRKLFSDQGIYLYKILNQKTGNSHQGKLIVQ